MEACNASKVEIEHCIKPVFIIVTCLKGYNYNAIFAGIKLKLQCKLKKVLVKICNLKSWNQNFNILPVTGGCNLILLNEIGSRSKAE